MKLQNKVKKEKVILELEVQDLKRKVDQETEHDRLQRVERERAMLQREVQDMKHEAEVQTKHLLQTNVYIFKLNRHI